ncbi:MAG: hypothetical protein EFT35_07775 [Methanophagales archaeon ANME-1-THS]|nr:MAG: hypothetical protein EFT35_07775 [Methanophagales archaeon ANME-1-THS]
MVKIESKNWVVQPSEARRLLREEIGTPLFSITNTTAYRSPASILAGETWDFNTENYAPFSKYEPYNVVEVTNTGTSNIRFYWNGWPDLGFLVFGSSSRKIEKEGFREFRISNIGSSDLGPETLEIGFYRTGLTADERARQLGVPINVMDILRNFKIVTR